MPSLVVIGSQIKEKQSGGILYFTKIVQPEKGQILSEKYLIAGFQYLSTFEDGSFCQEKLLKLCV